MPFSQSDLDLAFPDLEVDVPELGVGSFKAAYLVRDASGERVLKIISEPLVVEADEFDESAIPERIARELSGMSKVHCPHVVTLLGEPRLQAIGGVNYLVYEEPYYSGGTLEARLAVSETGTIPPAEVRSLLIAMLKASKELWAADSIVHRDIKPGNIVFDENDVPILLDLGIALYTTLSDLTDSMASSPRTNRYAAPEQFEMRRSAEIDFRTDQFLIGIVCYQALVGEHPFWEPGIAMSDYWARLMNFDPASLEKIEADDDLKAVVSRLLSAKPYRRYRTTEAPLKELGEVE